MPRPCTRVDHVQSANKEETMLHIFAIGAIAALGMTVAASSAPAVAVEQKDIVDTAVAAGSFKTLAKAPAAVLRNWRRFMAH